MSNADHDDDAKKGPVAQLKVPRVHSGKSDGYSMARSEIEPEARHTAHSMAGSQDLFTGDRSDFTGFVEAMQDIGAEVASGDLAILSRTMTAQALSLDILFSKLTRKSLSNMGEYPDAMERYMRLALKAQAQSRATIEALVHMHQPREQTVRHIHVGPDGQAVFIENYSGGLPNVRTNDRPHARGVAGPAMLGHDTQGNGVPITGSEREEAVPDARRRSRKRSAAGQSERS